MQGPPEVPPTSSAFKLDYIAAMASLAIDLADSKMLQAGFLSAGFRGGAGETLEWFWPSPEPVCTCIQSTGSMSML